MAPAAESGPVRENRETGIKMITIKATIYYILPRCQAGAQCLVYHQCARPSPRQVPSPASFTEEQIEAQRGAEPGSLMAATSPAAYLPN